MIDTKEKNLGLIFTRAISLLDWQRLGTLSKEIKPYVELSKYFKKIYFFTYGINDQSFKRFLPENVEIKSRPKFIPSFLYVFLMPLVHKNTFKKIEYLKTNQMDGSLAGVLAKKLFKSKLILRCGYEWLRYLEASRSSYWKRKIAYLIEKIAYKNADKISVTSVEASDFIKKRFMVSDARINIIGNYVDTDKFSPMPIDKDAKRVIFVGRLEKIKNLFNVIEALSGLSLHLVLIGEGNLREKLESHARLHKVEVEFLGNISQDSLPKELNKSSLFILASFSEGNPKVLLEAMSTGLPCIGADVSGIQNIIRNGSNGILSKTDALSLHVALEKLSSDESLRIKLGAEARKLMIEQYSFEKIFQKELFLYE